VLIAINLTKSEAAAIAGYDDPDADSLALKARAILQDWIQEVQDA